MALSVVTSSDSRRACFRLVGDVDMLAEQAFAETIDRVNSVPARLLVVDLAGVTFAGATLAHFLDALHDSHPAATLMLRRASSIVRVIVKVTGVDRYVVMSDDPVSPVADLEHLPPTVVVNARYDDEEFDGDRAHPLRRGVRVDT